MEKELWFNRTEMLISNYWLKVDKLKRLQARERVFLISIKTMEIRLEELKRIPGLTAKYGIVKHSQRLGDYSYADLMVEYEQQVEYITKQILKKNKELICVQSRIDEILEFTEPIKIAMERLNLDEQTITIQKFVFKKSNYQIGVLLNCSEKRIRYTYRKIICLIAGWLNKVQALESVKQDLHKNQCVEGW